MTTTNNQLAEVGVGRDCLFQGWVSIGQSFVDQPRVHRKLPEIVTLDCYSITCDSKNHFVNYRTSCVADFEMSVSFANY